MLVFLPLSVSSTAASLSVDLSPFHDETQASLVCRSLPKAITPLPPSRNEPCHVRKRAAEFGVGRCRIRGFFHRGMLEGAISPSSLFLS
jgi:hypothetical protein